MTDRRALLTDREREIVAGEADVEDSYRYQTISRVRARFDRLEEDLVALEQHGDLAEELRAIICTGEGDREQPEAPADEPRDQTDMATEPAGSRAGTPVEDVDTGESPDTPADVVDRVAAEEWEDTTERLETRKTAARAVLDYAREHGEVSKQEAKEEVYPEYPVEDQDARTWYRKNIRPVLNEAAEYDQSARAYQLVDDLDI